MFHVDENRITQDLACDIAAETSILAGCQKKKKAAGVGAAFLEGVRVPRR